MQEQEVITVESKDEDVTTPVQPEVKSARTLVPKFLRSYARRYANLTAAEIISERRRYGELTYRVGTKGITREQNKVTYA